MYAIIATGGKQYKVAAGDFVNVEKLGVEAVDLTVKVTRIHEPDMEVHENYGKYYGMYLELYDSLKELMKKSGGSQ